MSISQGQKEAEELQYSLRSTFFYRRHKEFKILLREIHNIDPHKYNWDSSENLGISQTSFNHIKNLSLPPCQVFCHPDLISKNPKLIAYYRLIALLPQKGIQRLAFGVKELEEGNTPTLQIERALGLARVLNAYISSIIDGDPNFSLEGILFAALMNFGSQVNGSWRNEIGREGTRRVKELLLTHFSDTNLVTEVTTRNKAILPPLGTIPPVSIDEIQTFTVRNGYKMEFASEPDISVISPSGCLDGAIEVKAGIDPAGALERYGAAKKSFDRALRENKACTTIYLASCITEGVKKAMMDDRLVKQEFNLTGIFVEEKARNEFLRYIQWLMHL